MGRTNPDGGFVFPSAPREGEAPAPAELRLHDVTHVRRDRLPAPISLYEYISISHFPAHILALVLLFRRDAAGYHRRVPKDAHPRVRVGEGRVLISTRLEARQKLASAMRRRSSAALHRQTPSAS